MNVPGNVIGTLTQRKGMIVHSTRSGQNYNTTQEYNATINYIKAGADGLGWTATVGDGIVAMHMKIGEWGWNVRGASDEWVAVELAQAKLDGPILDSQIEGVAAVWIKAREYYGTTFPLHFVNHSDLPEGIADGKTDVCRRGDTSVIDRIVKLLHQSGYN